MTAVDLGAAPGGWAQVAARDGSPVDLVISDMAPNMDEVGAVD
ncbi:SAM-dependent methyltransferase [uncultured Gilvimarinus sp.]|tara:strand:+ start:2243 stop:2371 length:129 start_codon:yes stop_codon:yes gene_type:complete